MNLKSLAIGAVALGLLTGGGYLTTAYASSNDSVKSEVQLAKVDIKTFGPGEMPEIPAGATEMEKTKLDLETAKVDVKTFSGQAQSG
ncbi:hypothetical protein PC41400_16720 [Paenibacillus chitinolyticus]|uniref:Uncharacterized protein n=1 Tax=Paenibacillus chitinolyticus TaxID=79263 RepID=A0A410WXT1_9BACL|nr:hypothetical protein [Paenibacillus chitinolyticus]MCY9589859.1 hypothetical protein [Paenibacillus chitinolyticus]MCY9598140.1 hypothetical protein [Paenibacillus chitinolyticus]QAV19235.1 hypothetical protein PC41400_16720 [Paenibacillus chitinolyticus]